MSIRTAHAKDIGNPHNVYPATESHIQGLLGPTNTVATCNAGTPEYDAMGVDNDYDVIDFGKLLDTHLLNGGGGNANKRGNLQNNFGLAGGQNTAPIQDPELCLKYKGACVPRVLSGTLQEDGKLVSWVEQVLEIGSRIGRKMGIDYCQDDFLSYHPLYRGHFDLINDLLNNTGSRRSKITFAAFTIAAFELIEGNRVRRHTDLENDPVLSGSLIMSEIIKRGNSWWRVSIIFYMRKSVSDSLLRVRASGETTDLCEMYLTNLKAKEGYRYPGYGPEKYFLEGVGEDGLVFTWNNREGVLENVALRSKATCNKQCTFFSPVVSAIRDLIKFRGLETQTELMEVIAVIGSMCGFYTMTTALLFMQDHWERKDSAGLPGGLFQYIIELMIRFAGVATGGPSPRCMNFVTRDFTVGDIRMNCQYISKFVNEYKRLTPNQLPRTAKEQRSKTQNDIYKMARYLRFGGVFSVQHLKDVFGLLGMLPSFVLEYGVISASVAHNQKVSGKADCMQAYLDDKECELDVDDSNSVSKNGNKATRQAKYSVVLSSIARFLRVYTDQPYLTEADAENIACEARRSNGVYDLWTACSPIFQMQVTESGRVWRMATPTLCTGSDGTAPDGGNLHSLVGLVEFEWEDVKAPSEPTSLSVFDSPRKDVDGAALGGGRSIIWDATVEDRNEALAQRVSIGRKGSQKEPEFFQGVITKEMLSDHPGLIDKIKLAMIRRQGSPNRHSEVRARLNEIPELVQMVQAVKNGNSRVLTGKRRKRKAIINEVMPGKKARKIVTAAAGLTATPAPTALVSFYCDLPADFSRCSYRLDEETGVQMRLYTTKGQLDGTLVDSFLGCKMVHEVASAPNCIAINVPNLMHSIFCSTVKDKSRHEKMRVKMTRDRNRRSSGPPTAHLIPVQSGARVLYRFSLTSLEFPPDLGKSNLCHLRDSIAVSLGGRMADASDNEKNELWHFISPADALLHAFLVSLCTCSSVTLYRKMLSRLKTRCASGAAMASGGICIAKYCDEGASYGTLSYYLIGSDDCATKSHFLAVGFPAKVNSANGRMSGAAYARARRLTLVRLL